MPELAEVEFYRKQWDPGLGEPVVRVHTHPAARIYRDVPAAAIKEGLMGRRLLASHAHGKQMMFEFSGGAWLGLHLGMSGELFAAAPEYERRNRDHLVFVLRSGQLIFSDYRMFGKLTLDVRADDSPPDWWQNLPPRLTGSGFTKKRHADFMRRFPRTPLKTVLLDQRGFPGIGNWMADEVCWKLQIAPQTRLENLSDTQIDAVWKATRQISREALRIIGADWGDLPDSWLMNHPLAGRRHLPAARLRGGVDEGGSAGSHDLLVSALSRVADIDTLGHTPQSRLMIVIERFYSLGEAESARLELGFHGIEAFIEHENTASLTPFLMNGRRGGIELKIAAAHTEAAQEILGEWKARHREAEGDPPFARYFFPVAIGAVLGLCFNLPGAAIGALLAFFVVTIYNQGVNKGYIAGRTEREDKSPID